MISQTILQVMCATAEVAGCAENLFGPSFERSQRRRHLHRVYGGRLKRYQERLLLHVRRSVDGMGFTVYCIRRNEAKKELTYLCFGVNRSFSARLVTNYKPISMKFVEKLCMAQNVFRFWWPSRTGVIERSSPLRERT